MIIGNEKWFFCILSKFKNFEWGFSDRVKKNKKEDNLEDHNWTVFSSWFFKVLVKWIYFTAKLIDVMFFAEKESEELDAFKTMTNENLICS